MCLHLLQSSCGFMSTKMHSLTKQQAW